MINTKREQAQEEEVGASQSPREATGINEKDFALGGVKGAPIVLKNVPPSLKQIQRQVQQEIDRDRRNKARAEHMAATQRPYMVATLPLKEDSGMHKWSQGDEQDVEDPASNRRDNRSMDHDTTTQHYPGFDKKLSTPLAHVNEFGNDEHRTTYYHMSAHKKYRAEAVAEFQNFELDDKSSKQTERASIQFKRRHEQTLSGTISPGELYRPRFQQQKDIANFKKHQNSETFNQDLKMYMNLNSSRSKKFGRKRKESFMSRNSKNRSPARLSSRAGSNNYESNIENKSIQKSPVGHQFKAQEQPAADIQHNEKLPLAKSPDLVSSQQARDFWQSDNMEVYPVQNKSVYYQHRDQAANQEKLEALNQTGFNKMVDMVETMRKDSVPSSPNVTDLDQRQLTQMYGIINSEVKILNEKELADSSGHQDDHMEGTLLETLKFRQVKFMDSANSDLLQAGVPSPIHLKPKGRIKWSQLTEQSQIELLKALQNIQTLFPDTKAGFLHVQRILSAVEGIPGTSKYSSNGFPRQQCSNIQKMKRAEADRKRSAENIAQDEQKQTSNERERSNGPRQTSQTMNMYLQTIQDQQMRMNTDPSKWMPQGQMIHPQTGPQKHEEKGRQNSKDEREVNKHLAPKSFKVTMQKRILAQRLSQQQRMNQTKTNMATSDQLGQQNLMTHPDDESTSRDRRSTLLQVKPGKDQDKSESPTPEQFSGPWKISAMTQNANTSSEEPVPQMQGSQSNPGLRVTGNFGVHRQKLIMPLQTNADETHEDEYPLDERSWEQQHYLNARLTQQRLSAVGGKPIKKREPSGLHVNKIPGVQNEISVDQLESMKYEDLMTKGLQYGALTVKKATITPINLHEIMVARAAEQTAALHTKNVQDQAAGRGTPPEERQRVDSQLGHHPLNKFSKFSSSGAHVSSIQNIGITSMHTQSRDALVMGGPVQVPGSQKQSSDNIGSRIKPLNPHGSKADQENHKVQLVKYLTQMHPAENVGISEQDLRAANNNRQSTTERRNQSQDNRSPDFTQEQLEPTHIHQVTEHTNSQPNINRDSRESVEVKKPSLESHIPQRPMRALGHQMYIAEAIKEESISQANTPHISMKAPKPEDFAKKQFAPEIASKQSSKGAMPGSQSNKPQNGSQQQYAAIKPVLQPIIDIPSARKNSGRVSPLASAKNENHAKDEPQILNLTKQIQDYITNQDQVQGDPLHTERIPRIGPLIGKDISKCGSVDDKVRENIVNYFEQPRQMQMTPNKHLDSLAKKNQPQTASDNQGKSPRKQIKSQLRASNNLDATSKSNKGQGQNKYKADNEDISQLLDERADNSERKSRRSQLSHSPDFKQQFDSFQQNKSENINPKSQFSQPMSRERRTPLKSEHKSQSEAPHIRTERSEQTKRWNTQNEPRISTANMTNQTFENIRMENQMYETVIVAGIPKVVYNKQYQEEDAKKDAFDSNQMNQGMTVATIRPQDRVLTIGRQGAVSTLQSRLNDPMNQTFGEMAKVHKQLNSTIGNFKFPARHAEDIKSQRMATEKRASVAEQLYVQNCNKESHYQTFYQGRFKRAEQHKVMVKKEQKIQRRKLAAQNKDLQVHLKELLPNSNDFNAEFTETASVDANVNVSKFKSENVSPRATVENTISNQQSKDLDSYKHFGNRKMTIDHATKVQTSDASKATLPIGQHLFNQSTDKVKTSRADSVPPIIEGTSNLTQLGQTVKSLHVKPEILEHDQALVNGHSTLYPSNNNEGSNLGGCKSNDAGQSYFSATSPTFFGVPPVNIPQVEQLKTPSINPYSGDNQLIVLQTKDNEKPGRVSDSKRSRYEDYDSQGSQGEKQRESIMEGMDIEKTVAATQAAQRFSGKKIPFKPNDDMNELSHELEDIVLRKQFKETSEKYGLLPAVRNAQMNKIIHNEDDLFRMMNYDETQNQKDTLRLKMQLKVLKNLNLKEKLHYQRLITANTRNKNFNLTQNSPDGSWLKGGMSMDGGPGFGDYFDTSQRQKPKKQKMTFRLRKLSELNEMDLKQPAAARQSSLHQKRISLFSQMDDDQDEKVVDDDNGDFNSVPSQMEASVYLQKHNSTDKKYAAFNKTVQVQQFGGKNQRQGTLPFMDTISNTQSLLGGFSHDKVPGIDGIKSNFAKLMNQSNYRAPFDPNKTQYSVTFQDEDRFQKAFRDKSNISPAGSKVGSFRQTIGNNQQMPKILRQLCNQRGDVIGYVRNEKLSMAHLNTQRHASVQPMSAKTTCTYAFPSIAGKTSSVLKDRLTTKMCNKQIYDLEKVKRVQNTMDQIGKYFGDNSMKDTTSKNKSELNTTRYALAD